MWRESMQALYVRYRTGILLVVTAAAIFLSFLWYLPGANYAGSMSEYHTFAFREFRFTNVMTMYVNHDLRTYDGPGYIVDGPGIEYPALLSMLIRAASGVSANGSNMPAYMWLNLAFILPAGLVVLLLIMRYPGSRPWLFAISPVLFLFALYNWDLIALALALGGFLLLSESTRRPDPGRRYNLRLEVGGFTLLALGCWFKLFPIVFLGVALIDRARRQLLQPVELGIGITLILSVLINLPLAFINYDSWSYFFTVHHNRPAELSLWYWLLGDMKPDVVNGPGMTYMINRLSAVVIVAGGLVIAALAWRSPRRNIMLPAAGLLLLWWMSFNKIYDPNFDLWLLVILAALAAPAWLNVGFVMMSAIWYFTAFEGHYYSITDGAEQIAAWHISHVLLFVLILRLAVLAAMLVWLVGKLFQVEQPEREEVGAQHARALLQPGAPRMEPSAMLEKLGFRRYASNR